MGSEFVKVKVEDLAKLRQDVELIKNILISEGELSDWAKEELSEARKNSKEKYVNMEEIEKEFS